MFKLSEIENDVFTTVMTDGKFERVRDIFYEHMQGMIAGTPPAEQKKIYFTGHIGLANKAYFHANESHRLSALEIYQEWVIFKNQGRPSQ